MMDPRYIKKLKMEILALIASSSNVYEIVNELTEYTRDINPAVAREAVKAVGRIALMVSHAQICMVVLGNTHLLLLLIARRHLTTTRKMGRVKIVIPHVVKRSRNKGSTRRTSLHA
jgi:hypothetical protein